ncbi:FecCD family ABC transporter permease [Cohnella thailandensis]|uniref:Iron ABC transporter permease n=1 Tax=Cohnella thailandensis TaxID=557557 RepID=A0A841SKM6_9BACL|nr:iron ABC transporter permease [Cohnella thailandensis]MBB6633063.1 iron ABC transporter permease [Cohnella thailandensis]MBP1975242.1 iron complex transport system permease protein [Cohnella thailandensis]
MIRTAKLQKQAVVILSLLLLIAATIIVGASLGSGALPFDRFFATLFGHGTAKEHLVLFSFRLPRIVVTLLAGMALALSGAILQGVTRNDLADPGVIGINAGAGVAIATFYLFLPVDPSSFAYVLPLVAFLGALATAAIIYLFSYSKQTGLQPVKLVLVGIGFALALNGLMVVLISSTDPRKVDFIAKWLAGNIWGADWPFVLALLPWLVVLLPYTLYKSNTLNLLAMDEGIAVGTGVSVNRERLLLLGTAVALASSAVAVTGGIAFVGLMAPHIAKAIVGRRHQIYVPVAVLMGGWLLLFADTVGRHLVEPAGIPAGIMVALIGGPYFLYLLLRK